MFCHVQASTQQEWATPATAPVQQRPPARHLLQGLLVDATPANGAGGWGTDHGRGDGSDGSSGGGILTQLVAECQLDDQPSSHPEVISVPTRDLCISA